MMDRAPSAARGNFGAARVAAAAFTALACAALVFSYLNVGNGIAHSGGVRFALVLGAGGFVFGLVLLLLPPAGRRLCALLGLALAGCLFGAAISAYFLEATASLACLIVAMLCWLAAMMWPQTTSASLEAGA